MGVDAANDCYASWKVFQMLEKFRVDAGIEMPALIDYRDELDKKNLKKKRRFLESMRCARTEGARCVALYNDLIQLQKIRLNMGDELYSTQSEVIVEESSVALEESEL